MEPMPDLGIAWPELVPDTVENSSNSGDEASALFDAPPPVAQEEAPGELAENPQSPAPGGAPGDGPAPSVPLQPVRQLAQEQRDEPTEKVEDDGSQRRYEIVINGVESIADDMFRTRFDELSILREGKGKPANIAQINRRMRQDGEVLDKLLRAKGYYAARVRPAVQPPEQGSDRLRVAFDIAPGQLYTLTSVELSGLAGAGERAPMLRTAFPVEVGQPVDADRILAARDRLGHALGETGFPFATVGEPEVRIDHETRGGDLDVVVNTGGYRRFGGIIVEPGPKRLFSARHLERIARFDAEDTYATSDVEDLRNAIIATGLVSSVTLVPRDRGDGEHVDIAVAATPAPMRTIAGELGYGTGEGYRAEVSWQHRNFFPPEGALTVRGVAGTREQLLGVTYRRNNFRRRDNVLTASLTGSNTLYDAYRARTVSLAASLERQTNLIFQKKWVWSIGAELLASRERDRFGLNRTRTERTYFIAALPTSLTYDGSDDLLDPTRGFRLGTKISPEYALQNGSFGYVRAQMDGSAYLPVGAGVVLAGRVRLGSIIGSSAERIAPSRRFYAGGGASVRGYGYQSIGPRDLNNDPVGGRSLAEFSLEARVRLGAFGVVPFLDAGNISSGQLPRLSDVRYGAGVGLRYYSTFGPIRIDVGTPLNRQKGDSRIAVYVSLGQAF